MTRLWKFTGLLAASMGIAVVGASVYTTLALHQVAATWFSPLDPSELALWIIWSAVIAGIGLASAFLRHRMNVPTLGTAAIVVIPGTVAAWLGFMFGANTIFGDATALTTPMAWLRWPIVAMAFVTATLAAAYGIDFGEGLIPPPKTRTRVAGAPHSERDCLTERLCSLRHNFHR